MVDFPIEVLPNPAKRIIPHPCSQAAEDRNWDAVINILNEFYNSIRRRGTLLAQCVASVSGDPCTVDAGPPCSSDAVINLTGFALWGEDDAEDPIVVPTQAENILSMSVKNGDVMIIAYNPNDGKWYMVNVTHVIRGVVVGVDKIAEGVQVTYDNISATGCACTYTDIIPTTTKTVLQAMRLDTSGVCTVKSTPTEIEVWSAADGVEATEWSYQEVALLNDVYQTSATSDVYGFYYLIYTPCLAPGGQELLLDTVSCDPESGSGSGS